MARTNKLKGITLNGVALDSLELPDKNDPEIKEVLKETLKEMKSSAKRHFVSSCGSMIEKNGPVKIWTAEEIQKEYGPKMEQTKNLNTFYHSILKSIQRNGPCSIAVICDDIEAPYGRIQSRLSFLYKKLQQVGITELHRKLNPKHGGRGHVYWIEGATAEELTEKWLSVKGKSVLRVEKPLARAVLPTPSWRETKQVKTLIESVEDHPNWGIDRKEDTTTKEKEAPEVPSSLLTDLAEAIKEGRIDLNDIVSMLSVQHRRDTEEELATPHSSVVESLAGKIKLDVDVKVTFCFSTGAKS